MLLSNGGRSKACVRVYQPTGRDRLSDYARAPQVFHYVETPVGDIHRQHGPHRRAPGDERSMMREIDALFHLMCEAGASDLHLSVGMPPIVRKDGVMQPLDKAAAAARRRQRRAGCSIRSCRRRTARSSPNGTTPTSPTRFPGSRASARTCSWIAKGRGAVFRVIPNKILTAEQLGLSPAILQLCGLNKGLVLVTGPTGSGKSTTLCAMVDYINRNAAGSHHHDRGSDRVRAREQAVR